MGRPEFINMKAKSFCPRMSPEHSFYLVPSILFRVGQPDKRSPTNIFDTNCVTYAWGTLGKYDTRIQVVTCF